MTYLFRLKAHEKQRRAEVLLREGKFEEAAKCHEQVADLLAEAETQLKANLLPESTSVHEAHLLFTSFQLLTGMESIKLQRDYHKRQAAVVRYVKKISWVVYYTVITCNFVLV